MLAGLSALAWRLVSCHSDGKEVSMDLRTSLRADCAKEDRGHDPTGTATLITS